MNIQVCAKCKYIYPLCGTFKYDVFYFMSPLMVMLFVVMKLNIKNMYLKSFVINGTFNKSDTVMI